MESKEELKKGVEFSKMLDDLQRGIQDLCAETYKATKNPLPIEQTSDLLRRADAQIAEFEAVLAKYTDGRRKSIVSAGQQINALRRFAAAIRQAQSKC